MNCKTSSQKLQFGENKCKMIHVGNYQEQHKCLKLFVDKWEERETKNDITAEIEINDIFMGAIEMEEKEEQCYLGDIISKDGKNFKSLQARTMKGQGILQRILNILEGIPFGKLFFEVAKILRSSFLV